MATSGIRRRNRLVGPRRSDSYEMSGKWPESTMCSACGLIFRDGRWQHAREAEKGIHETLCPACQRVAHSYPAGTVELSGNFFERYRESILNLVRNAGAIEERDRPLERIMGIVDEDGRTVVTTTGIHTARRIGESLFRAYHGDFSFHYGDADRSIRVSWHR